MADDENASHTLLFIDMLGFAALTEKHPHRVVQEGPDETYGFTGSSTSPLQNEFMRFQRVLEQCLFEQSLYGGVQAMLFSDCAYLDAGHSLRAAVIATELMRNFVIEKTPVRMGIASGTFYGFKFSMDLSGPQMVTRSLFAGNCCCQGI